MKLRDLAPCAQCGAAPKVMIHKATGTVNISHTCEEGTSMAFQGHEAVEFWEALQDATITTEMTH